MASRLPFVLVRRVHISPQTPLAALKQHRSSVEDLLKRRFFLRPSFEIYDGVSGLYDYGPPGCSLKRNLEAAWRRHFVLEEDMFEVSCSNLTPEICLKASGHVDRFTDFMVKETAEAGEDCKSYRADKLIEEFFEGKLTSGSLTDADQAEIKGINVASMTAEQLHSLIHKYDIRAPGTNRKLTFPEPFNLMFATHIGPGGKLKAYLRPETAQGIFVNFRHLYEQNGGKLPLAVAQVGTGFRNEISPRDGLLRVREFTMAEIEHFVNPGDKSHPKFALISDKVLNIYSRSEQKANTEAVSMSAKEAISRKVIANETLGYFLVRTAEFLTKCGISHDCIRFRQHLDTEMSHYAKDCWDAEIFGSYGWVECVGIADRDCFDLKQHAKFSKKNLSAAERCDPPKLLSYIDLRPNKPHIGVSFKSLSQGILSSLSSLSESDKESILTRLSVHQSVTIQVENQSVSLSAAHISPIRVTKTVNSETFIPAVIEPSFGISRILYSIFEHTYQQRDDAVRGFFAFPPQIAPVKCSILPLSNAAELRPIIKRIKAELLYWDLQLEIDDTAVSIGKRYARTDELGIPFAATIDFQSLSDDMVTLRELKSTHQVRIPISALSTEVFSLTQGHKTWSDLAGRYPPK